MKKLLLIIIIIYLSALFYVTVKQTIKEVELLRENCLSCEQI